jgi:hypothetical protein
MMSKQTVEGTAPQDEFVCLSDKVIYPCTSKPPTVNDWMTLVSSDGVRYLIPKAKLLQESEVLRCAMSSLRMLL